MSCCANPFCKSVTAALVTLPNCGLIRHRSSVWNGFGKYVHGGEPLSANFRFQVPINPLHTQIPSTYGFFVVVVYFCFSENNRNIVLNYSQWSWALCNRDEHTQEWWMNLTLAKLPFRSGYLCGTCSLQGNLPENSNWNV